jgi:outer membrane immunogenic protein
MRRFIATLVGATMLGAPIASAADMPVKAPASPVPTVAPYNWTGWYVGAHGGYGWGGGDTNIGWSDPGGVAGIAAAVAAGVIPVTFSSNPKGALGGVQLGYNYQASPNWVIGAETDFSVSGIKGLQTITTAVAAAVPQVGSVSQSLEWFGTIRARLGFAVNNWLFYGTAGGAYGQLKYRYTLYNIAAPPVPLVNIVGTDSKTQWGWTAGGGVEYGWDRWTIRAEYLYVDLGDHSFNVPLNLFPTAAFIPDFENKYHIVRAALNYRF